MSKTKTKWIEDAAVTPPKMGQFSDGATAEKTATVGADRVLIDDSEAGNAKKYAQLSNVIKPASDIASATASTTTTSVTDVLVAGMTLTPASGTYLVWFSGSVSQSASNTLAYMSIYAAGVIDADSEREFRRGGAQGDVHTPFTCIGKVTVNGAQAIEGRWRVGSDTGTMYERNLTILKVA